MIAKIWFVKNKDDGTFYFDTLEAAERQAKSNDSYDQIYQTCLHFSRLISPDNLEAERREAKIEELEQVGANNYFGWCDDCNIPKLQIKSRIKQLKEQQCQGN